MTRRRDSPERSSPGADPLPTGRLLYIYVEDLDRILQEIESRGCEILEPVHFERGVRVAQFRDPGRNVTGIWERAAN